MSSAGQRLMPYLFGLLIQIATLSAGAGAPGSDKAILATPSRQCWNIGTTKILDSEVSVDSSNIGMWSLDSGSRFAIHSLTKAQKTSIVDLETGEEFEWPIEIDLFNTTNDGKFSVPAVFKNAKGENVAGIRLFDPATKSEKELPGYFTFLGRTAKPFGERKQTGQTWIDQNGQKFVEPAGDPLWGPLSSLGGDGKSRTYFMNQKGALRIFDSAGKIIFSGPESEFKFAYTIAGTSKILMPSAGNFFEPSTKARVVDLVTLEATDITLPEGWVVSSLFGGANASPDGNRILVKNTKYTFANKVLESGLGWYDITTQKLTIVDKGISIGAEFNRQGELCTATYPSKFECFDAKGQKTLSKNFSFMLLGIHSGQTGTALMQGMNRGILRDIFWDNRQICDIKETLISCDCDVDAGVLLPKLQQKIEELALTTACSQDFKPPLWTGLTKTPPETLSEAQALTWMLRVSKPGGFEPKGHLGILLGALRARLDQKYPEAMAAALAGVAYRSLNLFADIARQFPRIQKLRIPEKNMCWTSAEREQIRQTNYRRIRDTLAFYEKPTFRDVSLYAPLVKNFLTEKQVEDLADIGADKIEETVAATPVLGELFSSKVHKFAANALLEAFDHKYQNLTDLSITRNKTELHTFELGLHKPGSDWIESPGGFYYRQGQTYKVKDLSEPVKQSVTWNYDDKEYRAQIELNKLVLAEPPVTKANGPDYERMRAHSELQGTVIAGSNLGNSLTASTMDQYLAYYKKMDFVFSEPTIVKTRELLKSQIENGKMKYLVKEAHSDGDEKNLFRIDVSSKVLRGERIVNGVKETIELVSPDPNNSRTELIDNEEFGEWINERGRRGGPELLYVNSSCWSHKKAVEEISSAANPLLVNIATLTTMSTFTVDPTNPMRIMIDSIHKSLNFQQMTKALEANPGYREGRENVFLVPTDHLYNENITALTREPVKKKISVQVKNSDNTWVPYTIESEH